MPEDESSAEIYLSLVSLHLFFILDHIMILLDKCCSIVLLRLKWENLIYIVIVINLNASHHGTAVSGKHACT